MAVKQLTYDPESGNFYRNGGIAGSINKNGYRYIYYKGKNWRAARLAFVFMTGKEPELNVDHINRDRDDNRWCNLRLVDQLQNMANKTDNNRSVGVYWDEDRGKWQARASTRYGRKHLGRFTTHLAASYARHAYGS